MHGIAVEAELTQAFVILALNAIDPQQLPPELEPLEWAAGQIDNADALVGGVVEEPAFRPLLPGDRLDERRELLVAALENMRRRFDRVREDRLIAAQLDSELVAQFEKDVRNAWGRPRLIRAMFAAAEAYEEVEGRPESEIGFAVESWQSKSFFVRDRGAGGLELIVGDMTLELERGESSQLVAALSDAPRTEAREERPAAALRSAIKSLREEGSELTAVFVPWDWELSQALELDVPVSHGGDAIPPSWVPAEERQSFRGFAAGVPAFSLDAVEDGLVLIVALPRLGIWRQWTIDERADRLLVSVRSFTEQEARDMVEPDADEFTPDEIDERSRRVLTAVHVRLFEYFEIDIRDPTAARWISFANRSQQREA
jgi:hypothetical protein